MRNKLIINKKTYLEDDVFNMSLREIGDLQQELEIEIQSAINALNDIGDDDTSVAIRQKNSIHKKLNCMHHAQKWIGSIKKERYLDEYENRTYNKKFVEVANAILPKFFLKKIEKALREA